MVSNQPSIKEEDDSAIISTSSSMTGDGGSTTSQYIDGLQSRYNQGWKTVDLYDKEDHNDGYIGSSLDLDEHMGEWLVENDKPSRTGS